MRNAGNWTPCIGSRPLPPTCVAPYVRCEQARYLRLPPCSPSLSGLAPTPPSSHSRAALWKPLPVPRPTELFHLVRTDGVEEIGAIPGLFSSNSAIRSLLTADCLPAAPPAPCVSASAPEIRSA